MSALAKLQTRCSAVCWFVLVLLLIALSVSAQPTVLTNVADILVLPPERAALGLPVAVRGVVITYEASWNGPFFIQDATAGIFVDNWTGQRPAVGDLLEISGSTHPG